MLQRTRPGKKVKHVPNILDGILSPRSRMSDYIHPNHAKIAEWLEKELKPLWPKLEAK